MSPNYTISMSNPPHFLTQLGLKLGKENGKVASRATSTCRDALFETLIAFDKINN